MGLLQQNFIETLERSIKEHWDLPAFTDYGTDHTMTFGQVAQAIKDVHSLLQATGITKGDHVALMGINNTRWAVVYLGVITYGAVIVPILQDFKPDDAVHIVNHSDSVMLFISSKYWDGMSLDQMPAVKKVVLLEQLTMNNEQLTIVPDTLHFEARGNEEIASINYTSGTTGFTKGVITPLNALMGNVLFCGSEPDIHCGSHQLAFLPLAHAFGCAFDFLTSFCVGAQCFFLTKIPAPKLLLKAFAEVKPGCIFTVPLIMEKIYKKQIKPLLGKAYINWALKLPLLGDAIYKKIRRGLEEAFGNDFVEVIIGGAPLNQEVDEFLHKIGFRYTVGYGMTECAPLISFTHWDSYVPTSCGRALGKDLMDVKIDHPNAEGIGEIVVQGANMMVGYYKNEAETKKMFTTDGWLRTGDLGYIDDKGNIFIKGRCKTMLLGANGQNIYPEEIETRLNNMPYVMESLVVNRGDELVALVYPDYETADADDLNENALEKVMENNRRDLNKVLAQYEQVHAIQLHPQEFEKTPKKSIKRYLYAN